MADTKAFDSAVEILSEDIRTALKNIPDSKKNRIILRFSIGSKAGRRKTIT